MIRIVGRDTPAYYALQAAFAIEGIAQADDDDDGASVHFVMAGNRHPPEGSCVYFGEVSEEVADFFEVRKLSRREEQNVPLICSEPVWTAEELDVMSRFVSRGTRLPTRSRVIVTLRAGSGVETLLSDDVGNPLVLRRDNVVWATLDLAESLSMLLREAYLAQTGRGAGGWLSTWRPAQQIYYRIPRRLRARVQRGVIEGLNQKLAGWPAERFSTNYPIDKTGWVLVRAVVNLANLVSEALPTVSTWPHGFRSCVVVTHDIEPTRYAYRKGLPRLLGWLASNHASPHTINPVGYDARRNRSIWQHAEFEHNELGCHGWLHDGREASLPRADMSEGIALAKSTIESLSTRSVTSFRSPRLDRSDQLFDVLDNCGFTCDSTVPDVDRENTDRWGGGCSLNFPFHPIVERNSTWTRLNLLECPVTAPDCAMPVFAGMTESEAIALYALKLEWIEAVGGCYVAIFHCGVFDKEDSALRERLLAGFCSLLPGRSVWRATLRQLEHWWRMRESLHASISGGSPALLNNSAFLTPPTMLRWRGKTWKVPPLLPGTGWCAGSALSPVANTQRTSTPQTPPVQAFGSLSSR